MGIETNEYGYVNQKGNRYFIQRHACLHFNSGFKSKKQFEEWIIEQFEKHGLDWRAGYSWKYRDANDEFTLIKKDKSRVRF